MSEVETKVEVEFEDIIINLASGNPGALSVIDIIIKNYPSQLISILTLLTKNNIRGSDIWIIYKLCNKDINLFINYSFDTYTSKKIM